MGFHNWVQILQQLDPLLLVCRTFALKISVYFTSMNMNKLNRNFIVRKLIQSIVIFLPYVLFSYYILKSFSDFQERKTGLHEILRPVTQLPAPTVTVCSKDIFKNINIETTREEILQNLSLHAFTWEDFFHHDFIRNLSDMNPHEIFNPRLGVCLSVKFNNNITYTSKYWWLRFVRGMNFQVCSWNTVFSGGIVTTGLIG